MIKGLGVDIVEIGRMREVLARRPRIKERCFSAEEREYCESRSRPEVHYALRFAAKEAVLKALGTGFAGMSFTDVEVARDPRGRPVPRLNGRAARFAEESGIVEMHLSLSFTHTTAVASAVAIGQDEEAFRPTMQVTQRERLARAFKDMRAAIDAPAEAEGTARGS